MGHDTVSYTHLDVYKRQGYTHGRWTPHSSVPKRDSFDFSGWRYNPDFRRNNEGQNTREQYHQQLDQRPSTSSTPPQTSSKPPDKTFEYKGKQNIGRPKGQYKGNDGAVSYTHLDVYKRQAVNTIQEWAPTIVRPVEQESDDDVLTHSAWEDVDDLSLIHI